MKVTNTPGPAREKLRILVEGLGKSKGRVGWFESAKYADGTPVAYVAAIQEYGATFMHPGGTRYVVGKDGMATFVSNNFTGPVHGITGPHQITIPPRSFMRSTITEKKMVWAKQFERAAKAIIAGNETPASAMEKLGLMASGDVRQTIAKLTSPALKQSTITNRLRQRADGKTVGNLTKPLVFSRILITSLTYTVEA